MTLDNTNRKDAAASSPDDSETRLRILKITAVLLALACVILLAVLAFPSNIQEMTNGKSQDVCAEQQEVLAAYEGLTYQSRALSWINLTVQQAWRPYTADQLGMTQQSTTRFRDANGKTLFYLTTSNDWGGLLGVTDADGNRTYVYCLR